jgi:hypothetical protein
MIFSTLGGSARFEQLHPFFPQVFEFFRYSDLNAVERGLYPFVVLSNRFCHC